MVEDLELIYVGDPMCSWCWGFAPVLERLDARYDVPIRTVVGGLRAGADAQPLDERLRGFLAHHWEQVHEASGQPFSEAALEREDWVYDTEPACRSVVAMRGLAEDLTVEWFARIQRAFYVEGRDVTDPDVHVELASGPDVPGEAGGREGEVDGREGEVDGREAFDPGAFAERLTSDVVREETRADFAEARRLGALGFPTLLFRDGEEVVTVTRGFVPFEQLEPRLTGWLSERYGEAAEGLVCAVDVL